MGEIVDLYESDFPKLVRGLETTSSKELCSAWEDCLTRKPSKAARHLTALFKGLMSTKADRSSAKLEVFLCALKQLQMGDMLPKLTAEILGILMLETTQLPDEQLLNVLANIVDSITSAKHGPGKWLELFPHFMSTISTKDQIEHGGGTITGREYQSHLLEELCETQWPANFVASLAAIFKDMSLTQNEVKLIYEKLLHLLSELEYVNIPPVVYQLLQLSTKGHRQMVIYELVKFFNNEDVKFNVKAPEPINSSIVPETESPLDQSAYRAEELKRCQGTVLLHIMFAIRQDSQLGNELVRFFRLFRLLPKKFLTPFTLSLAFCISTDLQFQSQIFECLKTAMLNSYKGQALMRNSTWLRNVFEQCGDPDKIVIATIKHSANDWDHVLHGLIEFGFTMLDGYGSNKPAVGKSGRDLTLYGRSMCKLGSNVLFAIIKENRAMRSTIMEQILNHILPTESSSTFDYLELFAKSVQVAPQVYLDAGGQKVREVFDSLAGFPEIIARSFIQAIQPLLKSSPALRDAVLLFLRKAMFLREVNTRKIAVSGLLLCLANFKTGSYVTTLGSQSLPGSQASLSSSSQFNTDVQMHVQMNMKSTNEAFCLEVLGILRRSLSQQAEVRITLYMGLSKVIKQNPRLTDGALDLLLYQANLYIEAGALPPIRHQRCVQLHGESEPVLLEPLSHLIFSIHQCLFIAYEQHKNDNVAMELEDSEEPWTHALAALLDDLVKALVKAELEDFDLDKSADYSRITAAGQKNYLLATQVMGVCETLIEYIYLSTSNYSSDIANDILALFDIYQKLAAVIKEKSSATKKTGQPTQADIDETNASTAGIGKLKKAADKTQATKKRTHISAPTRHIKSVVSDEFVVTILKELIMDEIPEHQEALLLLRHRDGFESHFINVAIEKITHKEKTTLMLSSNDDTIYDQNDRFKMCCSFAKLLLHRYAELVQEKTVPSQNTLKIVGGFRNIVSLICSNYSDQLEPFLGRLVKERHKRSQRTGNLLNSLETIVKRLQEYVDALLDRLNDENASTYTNKEVISLLETLTLFIGKLPSDSQPFIDSVSWLERVVKKDAIDDNIVIKNILILLLLMKRQQETSNLMATLKCIAQDTHLHMTDIDPAVQLKGRKQFRVIPLLVVPSVIILIIEELATCQVELSWALDILKANLMTGDRSDVSWNERHNKESSICRCLTNMAAIMLELIQSAIPAGQCVETLLRFVTKYYGALNEVVKYFTSAHGVKKGPLGQHLEKLVKFINIEVTQKVYPFITYIQKVSNEGETVRKPKKKGSKVATEVAQAIKEARLIPPLIYNLEQYERGLILLTQKSKVDLTSKMKMSVNRDFRIEINSHRAEEEEEEEPEEAESEPAAEENEPQPSTSSGTKRRSSAPPRNNSQDEDDDDDDADDDAVQQRKSKSQNKRRKANETTPKKSKLSKGTKKRINLTPKSLPPI